MIKENFNTIDKKTIPGHPVFCFPLFVSVFLKPVPFSASYLVHSILHFLHPPFLYVPKYTTDVPFWWRNFEFCNFVLEKLKYLWLFYTRFLSKHRDWYASKSHRVCCCSNQNWICWLCITVITSPSSGDRTARYSTCRTSSLAHRLNESEFA